MDISITSTARRSYNGNEHFVAEMACGKHAASIWVCRGVDAHVRVVVKNASHRCWRGLGKRFATVADAVAAYKTAGVRSMIEAAYEMASA
jgi:hypothetical protein